LKRGKTIGGRWGLHNSKKREKKTHIFNPSSVRGQRFQKRGKAKNTEGQCLRPSERKKDVENRQEEHSGRGGPNGTALREKRGRKGGEGERKEKPKLKKGGGKEERREKPRRKHQRKWGGECRNLERWGIEETFDVNRMRPGGGGGAEKKNKRKQPESGGKKNLEAKKKTRLWFLTLRGGKEVW